jgi:hypothetical protein
MLGYEIDSLSRCYGSLQPSKVKYKFLRLDNHGIASSNRLHNASVFFFNVVISLSCYDFSALYLLGLFVKSLFKVLQQVRYPDQKFLAPMS